MNCPFCLVIDMIWQNDTDIEDLDGNPFIESYYECPKCETYITIAKKV